MRFRTVVSSSPLPRCTRDASKATSSPRLIRFSGLLFSSVGAGTALKGLAFILRPCPPNSNCPVESGGHKLRHRSSEVRILHMGVPLGHLETAVPEKLLYVVQADIRLNQPTGEVMSHVVRPEVGDLGLGHQRLPGRLDRTKVEHLMPFALTTPAHQHVGRLVVQRDITSLGAL